MQDGPTGEQILALVLEPSAATYGAVLRSIVEHKDFNYRSHDLRTLWEQFNTGDFVTVRDRLRDLSSLWVHNPDYHVLAFGVAKRLGDQKSMALESRFRQSCLQGMLASGDGSLARPYQVAYIDDEYALLRDLNKEAKKQSLVQDGRIVDVFECVDGSTVHFQLPNVDLETGRRITQGAKNLRA